MKKALIGLWIAASTTMVWASCTTHTINSNGRFITCTTCCVGGFCNTNCF